MYRIAHIESSFNGITFAEMTNEDFENYMIIFKNITKAAQLKLMKKIALNSSMDVLDYVKNVMINLNSKLEVSRREIHDVSQEYTIRAILLNQTFIENIKVYSKTLNINQKEEINTWINQNEKLQFLRILRNYTYHNTIPIRASLIQYDVLAQKYKNIKIELDKENLINNIRETGRDIRFIEMIEKMLDEETNVVNYIESWIEQSNLLYDMILGYLAENLNDQIKKFNDKFYNIFISTNGDVIDFHKNGTYNKYIMDKELYKRVVQRIKMK